MIKRIMKFIPYSHNPLFVVVHAKSLENSQRDDHLSWCILFSIGTGIGTRTMGHNM